MRRKREKGFVDRSIQALRDASGPPSIIAFQLSGTWHQDEPVLLVARSDAREWRAFVAREEGTGNRGVPGQVSLSTPVILEPELVANLASMSIPLVGGIASTSVTDDGSSLSVHVLAPHVRLEFSIEITFYEELGPYRELVRVWESLRRVVGLTP